MKRRSAAGRAMLAGQKVMVPAVLLIAVVCAPGCGPSGGRVSGRVQFRGEPVARGDVSFYDAKTGRGGMTAITSGSFAFSRPIDVGTYAVAVSPPAPARPEDPSPECRDIPRKYHEVESSGLSIIVKPGKNEYVIDLE